MDCGSEYRTRDRLRCRDVAALCAMYLRVRIFLIRLHALFVHTELNDMRYSSNYINS